MHDTPCVCIQVVVSVNPEITAFPDTTIRFASPDEAGSLLVESGMRFGGRLDVSVAMFRGTCVVCFFVDACVEFWKFGDIISGEFAQTHLYVRTYEILGFIVLSQEIYKSSQ